MPSFKEDPNNIIDLLNKLTNSQRLVLFGDAQRFERWLKEQKVTDKVNIKGF